MFAGKLCAGKSAVLLARGTQSMADRGAANGVADATVGASRYALYSSILHTIGVACGVTRDVPSGDWVQEDGLWRRPNINDN